MDDLETKPKLEQNGGLFKEPEIKENFKMKSEPVDFENPSISQTSIRIKEELNETNNSQKDNSDLNDIVELSDIKIENCENHFEDSENIIGSKKPKLDQGEGFFKEPEIEDPLASAHEGVKLFESDSTFSEKSKLKRPIDSVHDGKKETKCEMCDSSYVSKYYLNLHFEKFHQQVYCSICSKSYSSYDKLRNHISTVHEGKIHCPICSKIFSNQCKLGKHISTAHEGKNSFKCEKCGSNFTEKTDLKRHVESVHDYKKRDKEFNQHFDTRNHIEKGHEEKKFQCEKRDSSFVSNSLLKRHVQNFHLEKNLLRLISPDQLWVDQKSNEVNSLRITKLSKSESVDFEKPSISQTSIKIKEEVNEITTVQNCNSNVNNFVELSEPKIENCDNSYKESETECPKNFVGLTQAKLEIYDDEFEETNKEDPLNVNSNQKGIVKCLICGIYFKHQDSYNQHMRSFHLQWHSKFKYEKKSHYKCDTCNLKGLTIEGFKRHMLSIHGKKVINVKTFNKSKMDNGPVENSGGAKKPKLEQDEVNSPIKSKSVFLENPSISQTSTKTSKLRNQIETVHEKTKFQCESCDLSYVSNSLLESHVEKFHLGKNLFRMIDPDQFWVDRK